ncbi:MAG: transporter [Polaribacter sp.]|nr:transporter [Polaribacter sp.]
MFKKTLTFFFICGSFLVNAQYTGVINSNRPGFSESPYSVGKGVYQLETGFFYATSKVAPTFTIPESTGYSLFLRTSFFSEKLEFNTNVVLQKDKVAFKNIFTSHYFTTGISRLTLGAKYLLYQPTYKDKSKEIRSWKRRQAFDWKRAIPSVAIYLGVNTNFLNSIYKLEGISPKAGILLQNNLSEDFNIVSNLFYDYIGNDAAEISYIVTGTYNLNDYWSTFLEHQGVINNYQTRYNFGTGIVYLANRHFQVDASTRITFDDKTTGFYAGMGMSFRLDRHRDPYKIIDDDGNEIRIKNSSSSKIKKIFGRALEFFKFKKSRKKGKKRPSRKRKKKKKN